VFNIPDLYDVALLIPAIVLGLTFHEFAHGWVAYRLGDRTAHDLGRLTLNPLPHIDPVGLVFLFLAGFGWAKPVPVNPYAFKGDMKKSMLLVSLAGPATNMILAAVSALILGAFAGLRLPYFNDIMRYMIHINVVLAVFNLIPIPPLDGSKILAGILPGRQDWLYKLEQYGMILLLILVFSGAISIIFNVLVRPIVMLLLLFAASVSRLFIF